MDILMIGGSGFLSGTITRQALAAGHRVWAVTRGVRPLPEGARLLRADRHDPEAFHRAVREPGVHFDAVIDCIGYKPRDVHQDLRELRGLADHLVFISTDFVFDPERRRFPQDDEGAAYLTDDSYGAEKRRCEEVLLHEDSGDPAWTVLRPCHIYGPGSQLGCLPCHGRDPELIARLRRGEALRLVGGGMLLQQPIFAPDLAAIALACPETPGTHRRILLTAGPEIVLSRTYYELIAEALGCSCRIEEVPEQAYLRFHPEHRSFLCHRIYSLDPLAELGLPVPATPLAQGLFEHLRDMVGEENLRVPEK